MNRKKRIQPPEINSISRRRFVHSSTGCAACMALSPLTFTSTNPGTDGSARKLKIKIIYSLHAVVQPGPDWPNVGYPALSDITDHIKAVSCFRITEKGGTPSQFVAAVDRERERATPAGMLLKRNEKYIY